MITVELTEEELRAVLAVVAVVVSGHSENGVVDTTLDRAEHALDSALLEWEMRT